MANHPQQKHTWVYGLLLGIFGILFPMMAHAQTQDNAVWVRLSIVQAKIWPVTAKGGCWDACGWGKIVLPPRELHPYAHYLKHPGFLKMTKGWKAPDVRVKIQIGKHLLVTSVAKNTTQPTWRFTKLIKVRPTDHFSVVVEDMDSWGSDLIGRMKEDRLPQEIFEGGTLLLRKVMQVEELELRSVRLNTTAPSRRVVARLAPPPTKKDIAQTPPKKELLRNKPTPKKPVVHELAERPSPMLASASKDAPALVEPMKNAKRAEKWKPVDVGNGSSKQPKSRPIRLAQAEPVDTQAVPKAQRETARAKKTPSSIEELRPAPLPARVFRISLIKAHLWPTKPSQQCWDCWGKVKELPPRGLQEFTPYYTQPSFRAVATGGAAPDPWMQIKMGEHTWKTEARTDTLQPLWKKVEYVRLRKHDPIQIKILDKDAFSSEEIGTYRTKGLPSEIWERGGMWEIPTFGQVERVFVKMERLAQFESKLPIAKKPFASPSAVQFVRVTVVRARLWPLNAKGGCWDSCPGMGALKLPPRGLKDAAIYEKNADFQKLSKGRSAPDPRVRIQLGKYDVYITPTINNTLQPQWEASHVFRIRGHESLHVSVMDDDETIAHDFLRTYRSTRELVQRWSENEVGRFSTPYLPRAFFEGGRLILRSFGQVELLELKVEPLHRVVSNKQCSGVYRVRIAEVDVMETRANGKPWHSGIGSMKLPSPFLTVWLGNQKIETPVAHHRTKAIYQSSRLVPIRPDTTFAIEVSDFSVGINLSVDRSIRVPFLPIRIGIGMRRDPDVQQVGQTAHLSACELIQTAKNGMVRLPAFGRVRSVLMFFDRVR